MDLDHVFAKTTAAVSDLGSPVTVIAGSHWLAGDPLVRARPDLFTRDCRYGLAYSGEPPECLSIPPDADDPPLASDESSAAMTSRVRARSQAARLGRPAQVRGDDACQDLFGGDSAPPAEAAHGELEPVEHRGVIGQGEPLAADAPAAHGIAEPGLVVTGAGHEADDLSAEFAGPLADAPAGVAPLEFEPVGHQVDDTGPYRAIGKFRQKCQLRHDGKHALTCAYVKVARSAVGCDR